MTYEDLLQKIDLDDYDALWLTLYGEARGEPIEGIIGVASVIRNRVNEQKKNYHAIVTEPEQFSCWNKTDPNAPLLLELYKEEMDHEIDDPIIREIQYIATGIIHHDLRDNTMGSNHYLTTSLFNSEKCPEWAKKGKLNVHLGRQLFLTCR